MAKTNDEIKNAFDEANDKYNEASKLIEFIKIKTLEKNVVSKKELKKYMGWNRKKNNKIILE